VESPIYSGLLTALLGTALVNNLLGLIVVAVLVAYFYACGIVEERNLAATFPTAYPQYKSAQHGHRLREDAVRRAATARPGYLRDR
jgi:protein-S-isoprenylcysteine O-methyltransferase Ste14